jgi:colanic acid/amylovoran biosynthesis protein
MTTSNKPIFSLINHTGCYNRGCEAIVRSTLTILQSRWPDAAYILYSERPEYDRQVLRDAPSLTILPAKYPRYSVRWLFQEILHRVPQRGYLNRLGNGSRTGNHITLSVGGDMYTLDYGFPQRVIRTDLYRYASGEPVVVWGASIGPFDDDPALETRMKEHLSRAALLTVREEHTKTYLRSIGITENVIKVSDPAFIMEPAPIPSDLEEVFGRHRVLGLTMSALITKWREGQGKDTLVQECADFVRHAIEKGYYVLLIPHVIEEGIRTRNDEAFLQKIFDCVASDIRSQVKLVQGHKLDARQLKGIIGQCHFFFGARTHSTVASLSSQVPTVSIAYSQKARGINQDIFGHEEYVLETPDVSADTLAQMLDRLEREEDAIRERLAGVIPEQKKNAYAGLDGIASILDHNA